MQYISNVCKMFIWSLNQKNNKQCSNITKLQISIDSGYDPKDHYEGLWDEFMWCWDNLFVLLFSEILSNLPLQASENDLSKNRESGSTAHNSNTNKHWFVLRGHKQSVELNDA